MAHRTQTIYNGGVHARLNGEFTNIVDAPAW
jgi:hypothetical protein